jgi:uncharacterized protein (TIGR02996 family)
MITATQNAFREAIRETPDDLGLRLIFADWLEEHDDPVRAEFIRVQCELEGLLPNDPRRHELKEREQDLLEEHHKKWAPAMHMFHTLSIRGEFSCGFFDSLEVHTSTFLKAAPTIFGVTPVRRLQLHYTSPEDMRRLAAAEYLGRVPHIGFRRFITGAGALLHNGEPLPQLTELARSPHLNRVQSLDLSHNAIHPAGGLQDLVRSPHLMGLKTLQLNANPLGLQGIQVLVSSDPLRQLSELNLKQTQLGEEAIRTLLESALVRRLTRLNLDITRPGAAWEQLALSDALRNLTHLHLRGTELDDQVARLLAESPSLERVRFLDVRHNPLTPAGCDVLRARFGDAVLTWSC